ncbi:MAG: hypothetical protein AAF431_14885 [Pseudomonadota bacterium]
MFDIDTCAHPPEALLLRYKESGDYTDCYYTDLDQAVTLEEFVVNFYTTRLFKLERVILKAAINRPSTDAQARQLVNNEIQEFAAWTVEDRAPGQLLMCDVRERTRSWFMTQPITNGTRLYFGSAVVKQDDPSTEQPSMGWLFSGLLGFHKLYSIALLGSARKSLRRSQTTGESN